ncbi:HEAT repeat domain-containing protein [Herbaspirillum huttiense]|uniref:HEAT repeat domain-containing protein n=1 Tax=Herbaspirillum huttiense TaxID=863372 RepID=UPI001066D2B8|nr:HEAT repeat domain-containing protein [Herbaspirillum huttiense]QBP76624.1 HEAT repeat domain-containing protein [Herbaspirillum huttiense]
MQAILTDLIERMTVREPLVSSDESISWHAYREAEKLIDETLIEELRDFLKQKLTKEQRRAAYFIIGKIGKNCASAECALLLLNSVSAETDKYSLSSLLDLISDLPKPLHLDLSPLYFLLSDKRWLVRHSAIKSLMYCHHPEAEDKLISVLENTDSSYEIVYCQATLNNIGTSKALPALSKNLKSRKPDVKISAELAVEAILQRQSSLN